MDQGKEEEDGWQGDLGLEFIWLNRFYCMRLKKNQLGPPALETNWSE